MYTLDFIRHNWIKQNNYWLNCLAITEKDYDIESILQNIFNLIVYYQEDNYDNMALNEDVFDYLMNKVNRQTCNIISKICWTAFKVYT
jgi:hypothetical protein